ncbi:MAG: hypothetical protein ABR577_12845 [Pyrinomonadaceae bacterium]
MFTKKFLTILLSAAALLGAAVQARAQQTEDTVRITTRVVFVDALVKDKKTNQPVKNLARENFQVLDDGKPRTLSYFATDANRRKRPLALVVVLDMSSDAIIYLQKPEVIESIITSLGKLQPADEVAIMQRWYEPQPGFFTFQINSKIIEPLTRDRAKTNAALRGAQKFAAQNWPQVKKIFSFKEMWKEELKHPLETTVMMNDPTPPPIFTTAPDFVDALRSAPFRATLERPGSQIAIAEISDDLDGDTLKKSRESARSLIGTGVIVSSVNVERTLMGKMINVLGTVTSPMFRAQFHLSSYLSKQTGGITANVGNAEDFDKAFDEIIGGLNASYSLGFTLNENEIADKRLHRLQVSVKARDERGKARKLVVSARQGYCLCETESKVATPQASLVRPRT